MASRALAAAHAASCAAVAASVRRAGAAASLARALCSSSPESWPSRALCTSSPETWPSTPPAPATPLPRLHAPSLAAFDAALHGARTPFIVTGALSPDAWPALRWTAADLAQRFGDVRVPVELSRHGADYRHAHHPDARARANVRARIMDIAACLRVLTQAPYSLHCLQFVADEEMPLAAFVATFMAGAPGPGGWRGYLAQHDLLSRVPALADEAPLPTYVPAGRGAQRRVWLGPAGCATPLHRDPYANFFCQIVGRKRLRLYAASQADDIYAFEPPAPSVLRNTSRVTLNLTSVSDDASVEARRAAAAFPRFAAAPHWAAELAPGEALAMPAGTWHAVLALDDSLSVSYWWT
jgi:hypothetical protein